MCCTCCHIVYVKMGDSPLRCVAPINTETRHSETPPPQDPQTNHDDGTPDDYREAHNDAQTDDYKGAHNNAQADDYQGAHNDA